MPNKNIGKEGAKHQFKKGDERINRNGRPKAAFTIIKELGKSSEKKVDKGLIAEMSNILLTSNPSELKAFVAKHKDNLTLVESYLIQILSNKKGKDARQFKEFLELAGINYAQTTGKTGESETTGDAEVDKAIYYLGKAMAEVARNSTPKVKRDVMNCDAQYLILYGGRDSGKSHGIAEKIIVQLLNPIPFRGLIVRKFEATVKLSQFQKLQDIIGLWGLQDAFKINKNSGTVTCIYNGNFVTSKGLDDAAKIKSLSDFHFVWYEEPNTDKVTYNDFQTLDKTLRALTPQSLQQSVFTFNSDNPNSWLKDVFFPSGLGFEENLPDDYIVEPNNTHKYKAKIVHFTYRDNPYITHDRIEKLEVLKETDPIYYKIWCLGLWGGDPAGKVYSNWEIIPASIFDAVPKSEINRSYGVDWGFNDPSVIVETVFYENIFYVRELFYKSGTLPQDVRDAAQQICDSNSIFYCDHRPENNALLRDRFYVQEAKKDILSGITLCKSFPIKICETSLNLKREINSYSWKFDEKTNRYLDIPVGFDDHAMDAFRYSVYSNESIKAVYRHIYGKEI
jgi:phage terminase large subunit